LPGIKLEAVSRWYRTGPVPASDQPDYINGVIRLSGEPDPEALLRALHRIEAEAGRTRIALNAARVLDLDLLAVGDRVIARPDLVLPHPRLAERAFVLDPLCDIAPEWRHPILGRTARELRDALPPQRVEPLPSQQQTPI
ncbi:MAG: 2-amino-4-hydroxy-6-hydroxymethyldihydropteridine diphosphokinase, partial [Acetobacteraceae bacterium]|nr:2-amino-4-hydroxy-6-hydroxymethyldihydropteridine diphosphokinase [Acetobacteraceae bacterium]